MRLGPIGHFTADLPLQARQDQPHERVAGTTAKIIGVWMLRWHEHFIEDTEHGLQVAIEPHAQYTRPVAAIDRQDAMGWNLLDGLAIIEIVAKGLDLLLFDLLFLQFFLFLRRRLGLLSGQFSLLRGAGRRWRGVFRR